MTGASDGEGSLTGTLVVPCYNEAARLDVDRFTAVATLRHPARVMFVNDGSTDDTARVLESIRARDPTRFEVLDLEQNCGKAEAVRQGLLRAVEGPSGYVGYWDADLATPLDQVAPMAARMEEDSRVAAVLGSRVRLLGRRIERRAGRHYVGRFFATAASMALRIAVYDTQCGAKLFRVDEPFRRVLEEPFRARWAFDVELLARLITALEQDGRPVDAASGALVEYPLPVWHDVGGSKLRWWDGPKAFRSLGYVYWRYGRRR